ncbi:zona pellucida sperm-binding protein 3 receptor isoform 2 precursor [Mus musculus]|uniref:Zona pellucida sperm-binding protein 3 receptor n=2 Tax=Mus musculus TaxID=10090 RepID=G3X970_MOUSE|nr:zona pellucida sperm-binding protein 3 receptor isoform 2 precursor [Mus musculus]EDL39740.1 zona pellucida 3 receptor [Mus musculus]|eukprot:NP_033607.2 zona pellucida sperm-binding protein 3 receptor precursor [Mus musculus]
MITWSFIELWRTSHSTLFQMTLATVLMAPVLGDCGPPPLLPFASPTNQLYESTTFPSGTVLKYTCHHGFKRVNSSHLSCDENGSWVYSTFCARKRCKNPGELVNGKVEIPSDLLVGSIIEFSCSKGYLLIGSATSRCEVQGKGVDWSDSLPECVIATCEPPPPISNGKHSGRDDDLYTFGSVVIYNCDPTFTLLGNASIVCTVVNRTVGVWRPHPPACQKIVCHRPQILKGYLAPGFRQFYAYRDALEIRCKKGFILRGSSVIHCEANGEWFPSIPTCEPNGCTNIPDISYASWEGYKFPLRNFEVFEIGAKLKYQCKPGYRASLNDPQTVTCQENLTWSSTNGCERICCPTPDMEKIKIVSERRDFTGTCIYAYGDYVFYICNEGSYPMSTDGRSSCQADGKWDPAIPSCQADSGLQNRLALFTFPNISETNVTNKTYLFGHEENSTEHAMKGVCLKPMVINGNLSVERVIYAELENITIQCDPGYTIVGSPNIICSNRTWYPEVPSCQMEVLEDCRIVSRGAQLLHCLSSPEDVHRALKVYKLFLEIERLEHQKEKWIQLHRKPQSMKINRSFRLCN